MSIRYLLFALIAFLGCSSLYSQGAQVEFGKNRVQYHDDFLEWSEYESENFFTYWYGESRYVGQFVAQIAEYDFLEMQQLLEHRLNEKIQLIVYKDLTDFKQSNIGSEDVFTSSTWQAKIIGNKVFVYFNGDHNDLRRQVREGIASAYLQSMLFGSNLQEIVQNAVLLNLPEWFKQGVVSYCGEDWSTDWDNQLRLAMADENYKGFLDLAETQPRLAGHAMWYYIAQQYGPKTVSSLLYLTRINRSIDNGFLYVLGTSYKAVLRDWQDYFNARYSYDSQNRVALNGQEIPIKNKRKLPITQVSLSPDGQKVAYVQNEIGRYRVFVQDIATNEREVVFKYGSRNALQRTDYNYPLLAWSPTNNELTIIHEKRDVIYASQYDFSTKKLTTDNMPNQYHRIFSADHVNPGTLVLSAASRGASDLYLYYISTRQSTPITRDFYDDLDARVVQVRNRPGVIFASNRPDTLLRQQRLDTILPVATYDLFYYDLQERGNELTRITNSPLANERQPVALDTTYFGYLSDRHGIYNQEYGYLEDFVHHREQTIYFSDGTEVTLDADSVLTDLDRTTVDTIIITPIIRQRAVVNTISNVPQSLSVWHTAPLAGRQIMGVSDKERPTIIWSPMVTPTVTTPALSGYRLAELQLKRRQLTRPDRALLGPATNNPIPPVVAPTPAPVIETPSESSDDQEYLFQSPFVLKVPEKTTVKDTIVVPEPENTTEPVAEVEEIPGEAETAAPAILTNSNPYNEAISLHRFRPGRIIPYRVAFRTDYVTTRLDNSFLIDGLNSFAADQQDAFLPPMGILLESSFKDLFEDHEIKAGVRVPTSFNGTEYFVIYNNRKRRLDKQYAIYRRNLRTGDNNVFPNPIRQEYNVLMGQFAVRYPLDVFTSLRGLSYWRQDRVNYLATDRVTASVPASVTQRLGLRLEYIFDNTVDIDINLRSGSRYKVFSEMVKSFDVGQGDGLDIEGVQGYMGIVGFDARHYVRLGKLSILALRAAGATSFGKQRMLYQLGGVNNWLFFDFTPDIPVSNTQNYAFRALAAPMRGFGLNTRNGSTYALANAELRVPIFKYLNPRMRSGFFRNFQVVGFLDAGTAWEGSSPNDPANPLNTTTIDNGPLVSVTVNYFRDPIVAGYGIGARTTLFGYFVRVDYAWGIETRLVQEPELYFSFGMDF